jgi:hypothetical protein
LSIDLGSRGTVTIETLPAISVDSLEAKLEDSSQLSRAPVERGHQDPRVAGDERI